MKADELMIGDWVYGLYPNGKRYATPCCIAAIDIYPTNRSPRIVTVGGYGFQIEHLEAIPLTPEILKKNGFKDAQFYSELLWNDAFQIISDCSSLSIRCKNSDLSLSIPCDMVHELQHALRLCGIEKEIVI